MLRRAGHEVIETCEPTAGPIGRRIREMARSGVEVPGETELQWFTDDRREHVRKVIAPSLGRGSVVVTDRYFLSTVAYQGARGLDAKAILEASEAEFPLPDLVLLLEVDPAQGQGRLRARGGEIEGVFERQAFQEKVAGEFCAIDRAYVARIDARGDEDSVAKAVAERVRETLGLL